MTHSTIQPTTTSNHAYEQRLLPPQPSIGRSGWFRQFHARLMNKGTPAYNRMVDGRKRDLLGELTGTVLEIGPGTGANLPYYRPGIEWIGVEPSLAMHPYLTAQAANLALAGEVRTGVAESLDVADHSVDALVGTLVLCSVHDQAQVLSEVRRVLKPGGKFVFIEHVAAPHDTTARRWQEWITPAYKVLADGCHPNRETWTAIAAAGFHEVKLEHFTLPVPLNGPHIAGYAVR